MLKNGEAQCKFEVQSRQVWLAGVEGLCKEVVYNEAEGEVWGLVLEGFEEQNLTLT